VRKALGVQSHETRYATTQDGVHIAYQTHGTGPIDLVNIPAHVSNLDLWWERPEHVRFADRLASFARVIFFDKRGTGLSSRLSGAPDLETRTNDLRAVLDDCGVERVVLLAHVLDGTALAAMFAAAHPERTHSVVLWCPAASGKWAPDYPWGERQDEFDERVAFYERDWGRDAMVAGWQLGENVPTWSEDRDVERWMVRYFRNAATPGDAVALARLAHELDIRDLLQSVTAPALVLYRTGWEADEVEHIRHVAELLPHATVVGLDGKDRPLWVGDQGSVLGEIQAFVTGVRTAPAPDRVLATVLFTDIVGSTERAAELGDARWRATLERHDAAVRGEIERVGGRWIKSTGDGVLATFDGPARGVRCALAIGEALEALGLRVRAGVHTGEIELIDDDIGGMAVAIGARVTALAGAGDVMTSSTVKDLTAGSGLSFEDAGEHELKGVPDRWHLYRVVSG
jgi:class 3 adenylate cyclase